MYLNDWCSIVFHKDNQTIFTPPHATHVFWTLTTETITLGVLFRLSVRLSVSTCFNEPGHAWKFPRCLKQVESRLGCTLFPSFPCFLSGCDAFLWRSGKTAKVCWTSVDFKTQPTMHWSEVKKHIVIKNGKIFACFQGTFWRVNWVNDSRCVEYCLSRIAQSNMKCSMWLNLRFNPS